MPKTMPAPMLSGKAADIDPAAFRRALLAWYDRHARVLPWRATKGQTPDPYHVWLSEVMLQQTTVQAVIPYFGKFVDKWPTVRHLADAEDLDVMNAWAGLGYYARARNLLKCARVVADNHQGIFPDSFDGLLDLPGIGDYTAAAISSIAFNRVATVIDGNVDRVVTRVYAIENPLPDSKPEIREKAKRLFEKTPDRPGDFAQAMMDLGATICTPKSPKCMICPVASFCAARVQGMTEILPRRKEKAERPKRAGYIYWISNSRGQVLFETRPAKGLLGGMTGLPTSEWVDWPRKSRIWPDAGHISAIKTSDPVIMGKDYRIRHVFTHFELELRGVQVTAKLNAFSPAANQFWVEVKEIPSLGLPTVFKKFVRLMS